MHRALRPVTALALAVALPAGCGAGPATRTTGTGWAPEVTEVVRTQASTRSPEATATRSPGATASAGETSGEGVPGPSGTQPDLATSTPSATPGPLAGRVVAIDPGHNGGNSTSSQVNRQVPDGRGGTKPCDTSGTSTAGGYPEHSFTWDVSRRLGRILKAWGAQVKYTRRSDDGVGPCVDERGTFAQDVDADLKVSIHGDGSENTALKGYFVLISDPPLNDAQAEPSVELAQKICRSLGEAGFTENPAYPQGLSRRSDLGGLNHSTRPAVMVELGEMRNPDEAAVMESKDGRVRYAQALADAIMSWYRTH